MWGFLGGVSHVAVRCVRRPRAIQVGEVVKAEDDAERAARGG